MQGDIFVDQITYTYDHVNKLFISIGDIDQDTAGGLQQSLKDTDQKWIRAATPSWAYQTPTNSPMLYTA